MSSLNGKSHKRNTCSLHALLNEKMYQYTRESYTLIVLLYRIDALSSAVYVCLLERKTKQTKYVPEFFFFFRASLLVHSPRLLRPVMEQVFARWIGGAGKKAAKHFNVAAKLCTVCTCSSSARSGSVFSGGILRCVSLRVVTFVCLSCRVFFFALWTTENDACAQGWPASGAVKLSGIKMRYRPGLDLVLKGVSLDIKVSKEGRHYLPSVT